MREFTSSVPEHSYDAVVVGGSAGSLRVLQQLLAGLPADFPLPVVVVLHTSSLDMQDSLSLIARHSSMPVVEAREREAITPAQVYVAPGRYHLLIERDWYFSLSADPRVRYSRPSIDVLFESAADVFHDRLIGIILTGANDDGATGAARIKSAGGTILVQDPGDAEAAEMPLAAIAVAQPDWVGPVDAMAQHLLAVIKGQA